MPEGNPGRMEEGVPPVLVSSPSDDRPTQGEEGDLSTHSDDDDALDIVGEVEHHWIPRVVLRFTFGCWDRMMEAIGAVEEAMGRIKPLDGSSSVWEAFDRVLLVSQFANMIFIPMAVAWTCDLMHPTILALFYLSDLVGLLDCIIDMSKSYRDEFGLLVTDFRKIRNEYFLKRRGWLSVLANIPWDLTPLLYEFLIEEATCSPLGVFDPYRLWAILRLLRFIPMSKLLHFLITVKLSMIHMTVSRLAKNIFLIVLVSHLSACAFWFLSSILSHEKSWIRLNMLGYEDQYRHADVDLGYRYLRSLFAAEKAVFFVFRDVETVPERVYCLVEILLAAIVYGSLFGSLASIIRYMDSSEEEQELAEKHRRRVFQLQKYMQQKALPKEIQKRILDHEQFRYVRTQGIDESNMFRELPRVLQVDIYTHFYLKLVQSLPLFKDLDLSFQQSIVLALRPLTVLPGWCVFREGDEASEMYFVKSGAVEVFKDTKVFVTLGEGKFFGEIALMENIKRTASIRAIAQTELAVLTREDFDAILASRPSVREQILKYVEEKKEQDRRRRAEQEREAEEKRRKEFEEEERKFAQKKSGNSDNSKISSRVIMSRASMASRTKLSMGSGTILPPKDQMNSALQKAQTVGHADGSNTSPHAGPRLLDKLERIASQIREGNMSFSKSPRNTPSRPNPGGGPTSISAADNSRGRNENLKSGTKPNIGDNLQTERSNPNVPGSERTSLKYSSAASKGSDPVSILKSSAAVDSIASDEMTPSDAVHRQDQKPDNLSPNVTSFPVQPTYVPYKPNSDLPSAVQQTGDLMKNSGEKGAQSPAPRVRVDGGVFAIWNRD
ncbi:hypothetical protein HDU93_001365 [Gonapodya sp. JEL0774]|nr:hypothetical protein HDU93_001365 [Gonapodya sp. JEL0774]